LSAPATISEADAELPLTSTASDDVVSPNPCSARRASRSRPDTVVTIVPLSTNRSESWTASSSRPPGLPRRSRIHDDAPLALISRIASATSDAIPFENCLTLT
jgi:hypothetical protein